MLPAVLWTAQHPLSQLGIPPGPHSAGQPGIQISMAAIQRDVTFAVNQAARLMPRGKSLFRSAGERGGRFGLIHPPPVFFSSRHSKRPLRKAIPSCIPRGSDSGKVPEPRPVALNCRCCRVKRLEPASRTFGAAAQWCFLSREGVPVPDRRLRRESEGLDPVLGASPTPSPGAAQSCFTALGQARDATCVLCFPKVWGSVLFLPFALGWMPAWRGPVQPQPWLTRHPPPVCPGSPLLGSGFLLLRAGQGTLRAMHLHWSLGRWLSALCLSLPSAKNTAELVIFSRHPSADIPQAGSGVDWLFKSAPPPICSQTLARVSGVRWGGGFLSWEHPLRQLSLVCAPSAGLPLTRLICHSGLPSPAGVAGGGRGSLSPDGQGHRCGGCAAFVSRRGPWPSKRAGWPRGRLPPGLGAPIRSLA